MSVSLDHDHRRGVQPKTEREERRRVILPGWVIREDDSILEITVADLSYTGCKVVCEAQLDRGERIRLSIPQRGVVKAEVRWCLGNQAGFLFQDFAPAQPEWPRKVDRVKVSAKFNLRRCGKLKYDVRVFDLSTHGCKIEFVDLPATDERVWVKIEGLEAIEAEVCWLDGFIGGLKFLKQLHPAVLSFLLAKLEAA